MRGRGIRLHDIQLSSTTVESWEKELIVEKTIKSFKFQYDKRDLVIKFKKSFMYIKFRSACFSHFYFDIKKYLILKNK